MLAGPSHVPRDGEFDASELRRADRVWLLGQLGPITARRIPSPAQPPQLKEVCNAPLSTCAGGIPDGMGQ